MKSKNGIVILSALVAGGIFSASVQASFILRLSSGADNIFVVNDDTTNFGTQRPDSLPSDPQVINYTGTVGAFTLSVTSGFSNKPGGPLGAILQTSTLDIRNFTGGSASLDIQLEDTGFNNPLGTGMDLESSLSGNLFFAAIGDDVKFKSYADASDAQGGLATSTPLQQYTVTSLPIGVQSTVTPSTVDAPFTALSSYSLTNHFTISLSPFAQANLVGTTSVLPTTGSTPEPATLLLLSLGSTVLLKRRSRA